jgi:nucleoside phosphorylase
VILVCAPTQWEYRPLSTLKGVKVIRTGMGAQRTMETLSRAKHVKSPWSLVISAGLAGALQPGMETGDIVADLRESPIEYPQAARRAAAALGLKLHFGKIVPAGGVLGPDEKRRLGVRLRACAVDMESEAVRAWAAEAGAPCLTVRAVLDTVTQNCPPAPKGEDALSLTLYVLSNLHRLPLLLRTGLQQRRAMANLTAFLGLFMEELQK